MSLHIKGTTLYKLEVQHFYSQHYDDSDLFSFRSCSPFRLCMVVPALKGRGAAEVIANAR